LIFITAKFRVKPEEADHWPAIAHAFTEATRAEPGNLWFDWSRSVDDPTEYVLVEAFADDDAAPPTCSPTTSGPPSRSSLVTSPRPRGS
jgi:quinol monooxygenase YgiN